MRSLGSRSGAMRKDDGLLLGVPVNEYGVRCTRKRTLSHSIEDFMSARLFVLNPVPDGECRLKIKSRNLDSSGHPLCTKR